MICARMTKMGGSSTNRTNNLRAQCVINFRPNEIVNTEINKKVG